MSSPGGRLREVVNYESLDHIGPKFCLISIWKLQRPTPCLNVAKKNPVLPIEKFPVSFITQECDNVTTYYPVSALLSAKWSLTGG